MTRKNLREIDGLIIERGGMDGCLYRLRKDVELSNK